MRKRWKRSNRRSWHNSGFPIPMRSGWIEMPDSDPTHDNPRNVRNLPAVVSPGDGRSSSENWLRRAIRILFGWKAGSVRDDLQVVLDASTPDDVGFSTVRSEEHT